MGFKIFLNRKNNILMKMNPKWTLLTLLMRKMHLKFIRCRCLVGDISRIVTIHPENYNADAKKVGEAFRENIPVILNLSFLGSEEAKRMI